MAQLWQWGKLENMFFGKSGQSHHFIITSMTTTTSTSTTRTGILISTDGDSEGWAIQPNFRFFFLITSEQRKKYIFTSAFWSLFFSFTVKSVTAGRWPSSHGSPAEHDLSAWAALRTRQLRHLCAHNECTTWSRHFIRTKKCEGKSRHEKIWNQ